MAAQPPGTPSGRKRPTGRRQWIQTAERRLINVLQQRIAATQRQLEVKICEAGPADIRPLPDVLTVAIRNQTGRTIHEVPIPPGTGRKEPITFFALNDFPQDVIQRRITELLTYHDLHHQLADNEEVCSKVLEDIAHASFAATKLYVP